MVSYWGAGQATLAVEIGGFFAFTNYSVLQVDGTTVLGGTLELNLTNGFVPTALNSFDILRSDGSITGSFANVANGQRLFTTDGLGSFVVNYGPGNPNPNHVVLSQFLPGLPGDFDHDGNVDGDDLAQWRGDFGQNGFSDANGDGDSDAADFLAWQQQFGRGPAVAPAADAVPEPATFVLLIVAAAGWCQRRGRPHRKFQKLINA